MSQVNIENKEVENERFFLDEDVIYFLGPNLTFRKCNLVLKVTARDLVLIGTRFIDCSIEIKRPLRGADWEHSFLKGCRFTGSISGSDFGTWPDDPTGSIEDCDFTGAVLDACRFIGCDASTLKFPSWPCFTILDPMRRKSELLALQWPGTSHIAVESFLESPPETVAVTYSATALAKRSGTTEEELRAILMKLDGVKL